MKKSLTVLTASLAALLLVGCGNDKKVVNEESNSNSNNESNITSNVESNSNIESNITSNIESNYNSNVTSNINNGGNDVLACTMDYSSQLGGSTNVYKSAIVNTNVKFVNGTANSIEMQMVFELTPTYASQIDMFVSTMKSTMQQQYTSTKGIKMTSDKLSATKFDIKITMDVTQMTEEELKSNNFDSFKTATFDQVKQALVQAGYTCK